MRKNHEPAGRRFWESYVELSCQQLDANILEVNIGADNPVLLTFPEAIEYASKVAKRENFGDLLEFEGDIRLYGQNHLAERKFYFKQIESGRIEKSVSVIFKKRPLRWGLRGDPYLWDELERAFAAVSLPCSEESFINHFETFFEYLTRHPFKGYGESVGVGRYDHGGMSGGQVSLVFWREEGLPLLLRRLKEEGRNAF